MLSTHDALPISGVDSIGHMHTCGVCANELVSCWGELSHLAPKSGNNFIQASSGMGHACAISKDFKVSCWGRNDYGESSPPSESFLQISSGQSFACGLRPNGIVQCWGKNDVGQSSPPSDIRFKKISSSIGVHACGIATDNDIRCWGNNDQGQSETQEGKHRSSLLSCFQKQHVVFSMMATILNSCNVHR